jgi:hypothetical protein
MTRKTIAAFLFLFAVGVAGACADQALQPDAGHKTGFIEQSWANWPPLAAVPQPADTAIGDFGNKIASMPGAGASILVKDAGGGFLAFNACNEGTSTTWVQCFNAPGLDAGGLNDAGATPMFMPLRVPAGACGSFSEPQGFSLGLSCYSSSTQPNLTVDAGVQNIAIDVTYR